MPPTTAAVVLLVQADVESREWNAERERAAKAGGDVFFVKPCLPEELLREGRRLLASWQVRDVRGTMTKADLPHKPADRRGLAADSTRLKRPQ